MKWGGGTNSRHWGGCKRHHPNVIDNATPYIHKAVQPKTWKIVDQCYMAVQLKIVELTRTLEGANNSQQLSNRNGTKIKNDIENSMNILENLVPDLQKLATATSLPPALFAFLF